MAEAVAEIAWDAVERARAVVVAAAELYLSQHSDVQAVQEAKRDEC